MKIRLGDLLVKSGVINEEQLKRALKLQEQTGLMLGEALIKGGFTTEDAITVAVSKQLGVPYASRDNQILKPEKGQGLENIIAEKFARDQLVLPLFVEEQTLAVAMVDPTNVLLLDNLRLMTGCEIQPFIASKAQLLKTIDEFYASGAGASLIDKALEKPAKGGAAEEVQVDVNEEFLDLDKVMAETGGGGVVALVNAVMKQSIAERASDIHLDVFEETVALRFRIDGTLYERTPPAKETVQGIISRIKILSKLDIAERRLPQDGAFSMKYQNRKVDVRVSVMPTVFGEKLVMRILDKGGAVKDIRKLGFDPRQLNDFLEAAGAPHGLIFLTGPTGSGKTTTLYAVLQAIYTPEMNFMTAEDPVEFKLAGISQCQMRANIGLTFASALRSFLRQDPDVILVGEVRDKETAEICLKAAMTGHLVLSTLHTNDAMGAVPRLVDMGMEAYMLADALQLVAGQRLVRALCEGCKVMYKPEPGSEIVEQCKREILLAADKLPPEDQWVWGKAVGCDKCAKTGYLGRRAIYEVYHMNSAMRTIISKTQDLPKLREEAFKVGMWNMRASGWRKVMEGVTTPEEVLATTLSE
jgi:type IV pilus assembly protein PilB